MTNPVKSKHYIHVWLARSGTVDTGVSDTSEGIFFFHLLYNFPNWVGKPLNLTVFYAQIS